MNRFLTLQLLLGLLGTSAAIAKPAPIPETQAVQGQPPEQQSTPEDSAAAAAATSNNKHHQAAGLLFETPMNFSEVQTLKNDTVGVVSEDQRITIRLFPLAPETLSFLNMEDSELINYVKYFFLGINSPSSNAPQRRFFNRSVTGELQIKRNNRGFALTEVYLVPLSAGYKVAIALEADDQLPIMEVEEAFNTLAQSLREDPEILEDRLKKLKKKK
ncbi:MAG: hypothetical protein ACFCU8_08570 [Thermosynechococcaceae cyanobacterium]